MVTSDLYIKRNAPSVAINAIRGLLWYGTPPADMLEQLADYWRHYGYCDPGEMRAAVMAYLHQAASGKAGLYKLLELDRRDLVSPRYRTVAEYLRGDCGLDTELTGDQVSATIAAAL